MTDQPPQDTSELLKRALAAIDQLQTKLAQAEAAKHEPIAIVGIGCRFPGGAEDPDDLWRLLIDGVDAVTEVPIERWDVAKIFDPDPDALGKTYTKWGAFLDGIDLFDAPFFGVTPREATNLDPAQRLLLEMSWRALEDAGIPPQSVANTQTGVYVGLASLDYMQHLSEMVGELGDAYAVTGTSHSIAGGRISYFLGAQGPNLSIDTACSSSSAAIHLAVRDLRAGDTNLALAGGVNVALLPGASIMTSRARMMSPTGRCHAFDASADGYVRAEGCGMVALKRLSDAQRDGDRIWAVIRGSAINQDGRSSGMTAPNGLAQEAVIRAALADARVSPKDIAFIEAHGTGTSIGDPIEVNALGNVFGDRPADRPLMIGSIKSNIGHAESAAGVAGLIKAVQALRHHRLPRQLLLDTPNPMINWDQWPVEAPRENRPIEAAPGAPLLCGVSSFGFSGTNTHIILQEAPPVPLVEVGPHAADASTLLAFSARTADAAAELAGRYADLLEREDAPSLRDIAANAPLARSHFAERVGVVAADAAEAVAALRAVAQGSNAPNVARGRTLSSAEPDIVFLFTGQGAQYVGMGKGLYETEPAFREALDECDRLARPYMQYGLIDVIFGRDGAGELIDDTTYTQPALFALEYAAAQMWRAWGVEPTAVMGHSVGEYAAAVVAGMLSLEDAIRLIATRGRLMGALPRGGAMAAVFATEETVRAAIAEDAGRLDVAGVNGPTNIVISGEAEALDAALARLAEQGVDTQRLNVSHAFHSALMDPILDEFAQTASEASFSPPTITLISNLTGRPMRDEGQQPDYWRRHLREAVRFSDSIATAQADGYRVFLEVGPAPILTGMAQRCSSDADAVFVSSLRRGRDDRRSMLEAAGKLFTAGVRLDWPAITGPRLSRASLPAYPFQRTRFWQDERIRPGGGGLSGAPTGHPLLGVRASTPIEIYQTELGVGLQPWTHDHRFFEHTPFPAAGYMELALAAAVQAGGQDVALENITIGEGLVLPDTGFVSAQVVVTPDSSGRKTVQVYSAVDQAGEGTAQWRLHASAVIAPRGEQVSPTLDASTADFHDVPPEPYYARIAAAGAEYGPAFQGIRSMRRRGREVVAEIVMPPGVEAETYLMHPALLDACFQPMGVGMEDEDAAEPSSELYMPVGARRYAVYKPGATAATCRVTVAPAEARARGALADIAAFDSEGELIAEAIGFEVHRITRASLERMLRASGPKADWRFVVDWRAGAEVEADADLTGQNWLILADAGGVAEGFAKRLRKAGAVVEMVARPAELDEKRLAAAVAKAVPIERPLHGAALLWPLDAPEDAVDLEALERAHADQVAGTLYGLRAVVDRAARVLVTTRGAEPAGSGPAGLVQAPVWAMAGVVASEHPTCGLTRIDLDPADRASDADALFAETCATDREDRIAYRDGVRRLARLAPEDPAATPQDAPVVLEVAEPGAFSGLAFVPVERSAPGPGQIEIRVFASGLNFRDVLNALGMRSDEPQPLGRECAGMVVAVGPGVTRFAVGDEVVALADRCLGTFAVAAEDMAVARPAHLTCQEAAGVPVAFLTAHYALDALCGVKAGDRVLIHGVAGGVGMAAAQIALRAGAVVYGTAGAPDRRELAKRLGVSLVSDSRSLAFVDDVMRETQGEGVDIVLNALAEEFVPASLGLVKAGGSFVEIGESAALDPQDVARDYPGVRYHAFDLTSAVDADPAAMRTALAQIFADMDAGLLRPLPQTVFPLGEAESAFRYMGQGLHTGKVVLTQPRAAAIRSDGAYVLTGGLTGLGLTTARWLAENGARNLVLLGRRAPGAEAQAAIAEIEALEATVRTAQVDVGDMPALAAVLDGVRADMGPIRGVMHAAGVLDDGMLSEQTPERFAKVMAPKVRGGWALHELTLKDPLDFFVLFSSGASLLGSPGQSNYAAANGFLDGLAAYRRVRGLPALSINWGSWAEVGMAAGVGVDHHRRWAAMGLEMITPEWGMEMLASMLASGAGPQVAAVPIVRSRLPAAVGPFYQALVVQGAETVQTEAVVNILADLQAAEAGARRGLIDAMLTDQVLRVLALPPGQKVDVHESLLNLGMDSLMAMDLRNRLQAAVGVRVAVSDLLEGASVIDLGAILMSEIAFDDAAAEAEGDLEWEEGDL